jgi:cell division protein FtsZ
MPSRFHLEEEKRLTVLKVVGIGGAGGNAVNRMVNNAFTGVDFIAVNTDLQVLRGSMAQQRIQVGQKLTRGLGSGGDPATGRRAAEESREAIRESLQGADMVFLTCGMGGGTGTGASAVVASVARETGALTVGIVTKPFFFEGDQRIAQAEAGIEELRNEVDTLLVIPNDKLLSITAENTSLLDAFSMADEVLCNATRGISDLITETGVVNLDFADVKSVMRNGGDAIMGTGFGKGEDGAEEAARMAINSPLLDSVSIKGATGILVNITGSKSLALRQVSKAATIVNKEAGPGAHVFLGAVIDETLKDDDLRVTVIATGFNAPRARREERAEPRVEERREINFRELLSDEPIEVVRFDSARPVFEDRERMRARDTEREKEKERERDGERERARAKEKEKEGEKDLEKVKEETIFADGGSIRSFNTDRFRIPTFVRKQMD